MTERELEAACAGVGERTINLYADLCAKIPKAIVVTGMTGGLAACAVEAGFDRDKVVAAINSAFDDILTPAE